MERPFSCRDGSQAPHASLTGQELGLAQGQVRGVALVSGHGDALQAKHLPRSGVADFPGLAILQTHGGKRNLDVNARRAGKAAPAAFVTHLALANHANNFILVHLPTWTPVS